MDPKLARECTASNSNTSQFKSIWHLWASIHSLTRVQTNLNPLSFSLPNLIGSQLPSGFLPSSASPMLGHDNLHGCSATASLVLSSPPCSPCACWLITTLASVAQALFCKYILSPSPLFPPSLLPSLLPVSFIFSLIPGGSPMPFNSIVLILRELLTSIFFSPV